MEEKFEKMNKKIGAFARNEMAKIEILPGVTLKNTAEGNIIKIKLPLHKYEAKLINKTPQGMRSEIKLHIQAAMESELNIINEKW